MTTLHVFLCLYRDPLLMLLTLLCGLGMGLWWGWNMGKQPRDARGRFCK